MRCALNFKTHLFWITLYLSVGRRRGMGALLQHRLRRGHPRGQGHRLRPPYQQVQSDLLTGRLGK